jgi:hypothetical protein
MSIETDGLHQHRHSILPYRWRRLEWQYDIKDPEIHEARGSVALDYDPRLRHFYHITYFACFAVVSSDPESKTGLISLALVPTGKLGEYSRVGFVLQNWRRELIESLISASDNVCHGQHAKFHKVKITLV